MWNLMESRIKELLDKYWAGETSLEEEKVIKQYFKENPSITEEGQYFRAIAANQKLTYKGEVPGKPRIFKKQWLSVAATVTIGVITALVAIDSSRKEDPFAVTDPKEAYEVTRQALMMISSNLNESRQYPAELNKINKAETIIKD